MSKSLNIHKNTIFKLVSLFLIMALFNITTVSTSAENNDTPLPSDLEVQWSTQLGSILKSTPVMDDEFIYLVSSIPTSTTVGSEGTLFTISKRSGEVKWQYNLGAKSEYTEKGATPIVLYQDRLFVCSNYNGLACLDKLTQDTLWSKPYNSINPPVIVQDRIYFTLSNRNLYCLDIENGEEIWSYPVGVTNCVPAIYGNYVFGADFDQIFILNLNTGDELKTVELYRTHQVEALSSPLIYDNKLIVTLSDYDLHVYALLGLEENQLIFGNELWTLEGRKYYPHFNQPVVYQDILLVCYNNEIQALDLNQGTSLWKRELNGRHLAFGNAEVVILSDTTVYNLDIATGETRWELDLAPELEDDNDLTILNSAVIIVDDGSIYIIEDSGTIYRLSASTVSDEDVEINYTLTICINVFIVIILILIIYAILKWRSKK